jgi:hypothetical protein
MLHAFARIVELRQAVRRQPKCLGHKPRELVAQILDRCEVPQESRLEPRHVLLVRPLGIPSSIHPIIDQNPNIPLHQKLHFNKIKFDFER